MLPFTTYHIPETGSVQNALPQYKAWFIVNTELSDGQKQLLTKIAQASGYDFETDVYILVRTQHGISLPSFFGNAAPELIISFGFTTQDFGWNIEMIKSLSIRLDRTTFISSCEVTLLETSADQKKLLWRELQAFLDSK